ncbi:Uncharacterised protein [uncultured Eubacterium sp.]|nr:Uncharacterised protein [uncultured Eubacterium sp.]
MRAFSKFSRRGFERTAKYKETKNKFLRKQEDFIMAFFNSAVGVLQTLVIARKAPPK